MRAYARIAPSWILIAVLPLVGCDDAAHTAGDEPADRASIRGTVLDRATGASVSGARVEFPDGRSAETDDAGRFECVDFEPGIVGEVRVLIDDGRRGSVELRPLGPGSLEVVLHAGH